MPTQVRLTTNSTSGEFNVNFKEEIYIPKNSKIALNGLCVESAFVNFRITQLNEKFSYKLENSDGHGGFTATLNLQNLELRNGIYTDETNIQLLFDELQKLLHTQNYSSFLPSLSFTVSDTSIDNAFFLLPLKQNDNALESIAIKVNTAYSGGNSGTYSKSNLATPGDSASFENYLSYNMFLQRGSGRTYIQLGNMTGISANAGPTAGTQGVLIGLVETEPDDDGTTVYGMSDIKYGIYINNQGSNYWTIFNGVETDSGQTREQAGDNLQNSDFLSIEKEGTNFVLKIYQPAYAPNGRTLTLATHAITDCNTKYYPILFIKGKQSTCRVRNIASTFENFTTTLQASTDLSTEYGGLEASNSHTPRLLNYVVENQIRHTITFDKENTASFLGFDKLSKEAFINNDDDSQLAIEGDNEIKFLVSANYHIIVLDNLKLKAYDGITESRQNVLAYIPVKEGSGGEILYEPNNLYYVDLDNRDDIRIRNIKARILDKEFNSITTSGVSVFSFLIN